MNPTQLAQQIKHKLKAVTWPSGGSLVFGEQGVRVFAGTPSEDQITAQRPLALVIIGAASADENHPDLLNQEFTVAVVVEVGGDPVGEFALVGGPVADMTKSAGKGLAEVCERVRYAVQSLSGADGVAIQITATTTAGPTPGNNGRHLAMAELQLSAVCTAQPFYMAPQRIRWTSGIWSWDGDCEDRFDFWRYRLVRKDGATPSSNTADGTTLYLGTVNGYTGAQTAGKTYTVFAEYDARGRGVAEGNSDPERGSYLVV